MLGVAQGRSPRYGQPNAISDTQSWIVLIPISWNRKILNLEKERSQKVSVGGIRLLSN